jgi:hypothetical protein
MCHIVIGSSILVGGLEEITVSLHGVWGALCLHTTPMEISTRKGMNFGIHLLGFDANNKNSFLLNLELPKDLSTSNDVTVNSSSEMYPRRLNTGITLPVVVF